MTTFEAVEPLPFIEGITYGEGPRWHDGRLWFSDGPAGRVYSAGETGDVAVEVEILRASGLGWLPDRTLVVSALFDAKVYHVDAQGNVAATYDLSHLAWSTLNASEMAGEIGLLDPAGTVRVVATDLALPNGLGFLPDGSTLVVSETNGSGLLEFPTEPDGSLGTACTTK
jgi:sugar lactone lactonase YvrE